MPTLQEQLQAAVVQTTTDSGLLHNIVHGNASTTVTTENGPVKSIAKVISENQALLTTSLSTLTTMRDQAVASAAAAADSETAAAGSESAAAASATAADTSAAEALASENAAAASEANASDSEDAAAASAAAAAISETNAAASEVAAGLSETNAAASETAAGGSASSASSSAGSASASAADAAASAAAAAGSAAGQLFSDVIDITFADSPFTVSNDANGHLYRVDTSGGAVQINLPTLGDLAADFRLGVAKATGDVNTVSVNRTGSDTINGLTTRTLAAQYNIDTFIGDKDNEAWFASGGGLGAVNITVQRFSGDGTETNFSLSGTPGSENNTNVYISGVYQQKDTYSLSGNLLSFGEAPPLGTDNVEVVFGAQAPIGVPADDTVGATQLKDGAVGTSKLVDGAVTLVKLAPISATKRLLGRNSAGAGTPEEVSLNQLLDWVGGTAQGDILYRGSTGWERLAAGTNGQFLKTQGVGVNPAWGTISVPSSDFVKIASVSNYSVTNIDFTGLDFSYAGTYAGYLWVIDELILPGNTDLHMVASTDGGSNWLAGTNYWYWANDLNGVNTNSTGAAQIRLSPWTLAGSVNGGAANGSTQGRIFMPAGSVTGMRYHTGITDFMMPKNADGNYLQVRGGFCIKAIDNGPPVNAIRFKCSSGDTSASKITLYGLKR